MKSAGKSAEASLHAMVQGSSVTSATLGARRQRGARTQVERSSEMRVRVLQATLECLAKFGYAGTTFDSIAKQAGVSRGALQHHYPERHFLIAGALEIWLDGLNSHLSTPSVEHASRKQVSSVLDQLWEAAISLPAVAVADVRTAARTNNQLRGMLLPLEHRVRERQCVAIAEAFGRDFRLSAEHRKRIDAVFATVRGLVVLLGIGWAKHEVEAIWERARGDYVAAFLPMGALTSADPKPTRQRAAGVAQEQRGTASVKPKRSAKPRKG